MKCVLANRKQMKHNGFTLIELLAVIIILAIIALLAVPKILDIMAEMKDSANRTSVYGIIESAQNYYADSVLDDEKKQNIGNKTNVYNIVTDPDFKSGENGVTYIDNDGRVAISVTIDKKCYVKTYKGQLQIFDRDSENCDLDYFVAIEDGGSGDVTPKYKCKRATVLHENPRVTGGFFGSLGTKGKLTSGDAFDCDVNGDGIYDSETERFYYVSDLYNAATNSFDSDYAVLIYSDSLVVAEYDEGRYKEYLVDYDSSSERYHGPRTGMTILPTADTWNNVQLSNNIRSILNEKDGKKIGTNDLPVDFNYDGYVARFLTVREILKGCNTEEAYGVNSVDLNNCTYLQENLGIQDKANDYYLENPNSSNGISAINPSPRISSTSSKSSVRPAIEVEKKDIDYGNERTEEQNKIYDIVCKKATDLHTGVCKSGMCRNFYSDGETFNYGQIGVDGRLKNGDAFDCDVNGDGIYDLKTERFYYVKDLDSDSDSDYAVLINSNTFSQNGRTIEEGTWKSAITDGLPKSTSWNNVKLTNTKKDYFEQNGIDFSYDGYSSRVLSLKEFVDACNPQSQYFVSIEDKDCLYFTENNASRIVFALEKEGYSLDSSRLSLETSSSHKGFVKPVIEVPKNNIAYGKKADITFEIIGNKDRDEYLNPSYIRINISDPKSEISNYLWCSGVDCEPKNEESKNYKTIALIKNGDSQVCLSVKYKNGQTSNKICSEILKIKEEEIFEPKLCRRATTLHSDVCKGGPCTASYVYLDEEGNDHTKNGYNVGDIFQFGQLGIAGKLSSGDAFDCDVNGDGIYDPETERFYYVSDLDSDNDYAVLLYYNNTGVLDEVSDSDKTYNPKFVLPYLPTVEQWKNVQLYNDIRPILTQNGKNMATTSAHGYSSIFSSEFSYNGYSARILTANEYLKSCNQSEDYYKVRLASCNYFMENTSYSKEGNTPLHYFLETLYGDSNGYTSDSIQTIYSGVSLSSINRNNSSPYGKGFGIRPAIEVSKDNIDYGITGSSSYEASVKDYTCPEGGTLSEDKEQCVVTTDPTLGCQTGYQLVGDKCYQIDNSKKTTELKCNLSGYEVCTNWNSTNPGKHQHCVYDHGDSHCPTGYGTLTSSTSTTCSYTYTNGWAPDNISGCTSAGYSNCTCTETGCSGDITVSKVCDSGTLFTGNDVDEDDKYVGKCYSYSTDVTVNNKCLDNYTLSNNNCISNKGISANTCLKGNLNSDNKCVSSYEPTKTYECPEGGTLNGRYCYR